MDPIDCSMEMESAINDTGLLHKERGEKKKKKSPRDGETIICCPSRRKSSRSNQREFQAINTIGSMLASWPRASARHSQVSLWLLSAQSVQNLHYLCGKAL